MMQKQKVRTKMNRARKQARPSHHQSLYRFEVLPHLRVLRLGIALAIPLYGLSPAYAAIANVTGNANTGAGSFRAAVGNATSGDTLNFNAVSGSIITLGSVVGTNKEFTFDLAFGTVTIQGNGFSGGPLYQTTGNLTFTGNGTFVFTGGKNKVTGTGGISVATYGGGVFAGGTITTLSSVVSGNTITATHAGTGDITASGGGVFAGTISTLSGEVSSNIITATHAGTGGDIAAWGGGVATDGNITTLSGEVSGNTITATHSGSITAWGGGVFAPTIGNISSTAKITGNTVDVGITNASSTGNIDASGGGVFAGTISTLSGEVSSNIITATHAGTGGNIAAWGGGVYTVGGIGDISSTAKITGNTIDANITNASSTSSINAFGGGVSANNITTLSGGVSGNTVKATTTGTGRAIALGGGVYLSNATTLTITEGIYQDNQAIATASTPGNAQAEGGAIFVNTANGSAKTLNLTAADGDIVFSGNKTITNGVTVDNDIHFGRESLTGNTANNATLNINGTTNNVSILGGVTADINNGKQFSLRKSGNVGFTWGGTNVLDAAGGAAVNLLSDVKLVDGFSMNNGGVNRGGNIAFTIGDGSNAAIIEQVSAAGGIPAGILSFTNTDINVNNLATYKIGQMTLDGGSMTMNTGSNLHVELYGKAASVPNLKAIGSASVTFSGSNNLSASWNSWLTPGDTRYLVVDTTGSTGTLTGTANLVAQNTATVQINNIDTTASAGQVWIDTTITPLIDPNSPVTPPVTSDPDPLIPPVISDPDPLIPPVISDPDPLIPPVTSDPDPLIPPVTSDPDPLIPPVISDPDPLIPPVISDPDPLIPPVISDPDPLIPPVISDPDPLIPPVTSDPDPLIPPVTSGPDPLIPPVTPEPPVIPPVTPDVVDPRHLTTPNGVRAYTGVYHVFGNHPVFNALDLHYGDPANWGQYNNGAAALHDELGKTLKYMSAEGSVTQAVFAQQMHNRAARMALSQAFGRKPVLMTAGEAVPQAFSSHYDSRHVRHTSMGDIPVQNVYSVIDNWKPANKANLTLMANKANDAGNASNDALLETTGISKGFWGGYLGDFSNTGSKGGYSGYKADHNGFILGMTFDINNQWSAGGYAGYTTGSTRYKDISTKVDTDVVHLGAYGRFYGQGDLKGFSVTADILYSSTDNDSRRNVPLSIGKQQMKGSFDQSIWGAGLELSYHHFIDPMTSITPFVSMRYSHLKQDAYRESGPLALEVGKVEGDSFTTTIGASFAKDFILSSKTVVTPQFSLGWLHEFGDKNVSTRSSFAGSPVTFMTRSTDRGKDALLFGASLDARVKTVNGRNVGFKAAYAVDIRNNGTDHNLFAGLEYRF